MHPSDKIALPKSGFPKTNVFIEAKTEHERPCQMAIV